MRLSRVLTASATVWALGSCFGAATASAEWNIDAYVGSTYSDDEDGETGEITFGARAGYFFSLGESKFDLGPFIDASGVIDDDDDTPRDFTFVPVSALGMLRYRLIEAEGFALHPYAAVGPSAVWNQLEIGSADDDDVDVGLDARGGLRAIIYDRFAVFTEYRYNQFDSNYDLSDVGPDIEVDDNYHSILFGLGYRFVSAAEPPPPPPPAPEPAPAAEPEPLPPPTKQRLVLRGVTFAFDKSDLSPEATGILDSAATALKGTPEAEVVVEGHTDAIGSDDYNMKLSQRRATSVRDYLVGQGVASERLSVEAFGESQPVADNDTEEGRAQNRRVELEVND